jgi:hypothetical protein
MSTRQQTRADATIPDDLIDARAVARLVRAHIATVYRWLLSGRLRAWKRCGRLFASRAEALALFAPVQPRKAERLSPSRTERSRAAEAAVEELRRQGFRVP